MKIVIGLYSLEPGGTEFQMSLLAKGLIDRGHEVIFYLISPSIHPYMSSFTTRAMLLRDSHIPQIIRQLPYWRKWLREDEPDVIIGALPVPHILSTLSTLSIPIIGRRGFSWPEILHLPNYKRAFKYVRHTLPWVSRRTRTLVCNAFHVAESAITVEGWKGEKVTIINNGWPEYPPINYTSLRTIYSGRNRVEKDVSIPGVERVTTIPVWSDVGIYVHPTRAEGCSNSIGMAMAHGIPVIATRTKGNKELLGWSYQALVDHDSTFRAWINMLHSSQSMREYLGGLCRSRIHNYYSLKLMVDKWEVLLDEACKRNTH